MPVLLKPEELQPGMRLDAAIMSNDRVMLPAGKVLTDGDIEAVLRRFPDERVPIGDPVLDKFVEFEDDSQERRVAAVAQQKIGDAMAHVQERFADRADMTTVDFPGVEESMRQVMSYLAENPVSFALLNRQLDSDSYLSEHTGNVFYLSMVLGSAVSHSIAEQRRQQTAAEGLSQRVALDLTPLGLGAMFMDTGMLPLQDLYTKDELLSEQDRQLVEQHPVVGRLERLVQHLGGNCRNGRVARRDHDVGMVLLEHLPHRNCLDATAAHQVGAVLGERHRGLVEGTRPETIRDLAQGPELVCPHAGGVDALPWRVVGCQPERYGNAGDLGRLSVSSRVFVQLDAGERCHRSKRRQGVDLNGGAPRAAQQHQAVGWKHRAGAQVDGVFVAELHCAALTAR